MVPSIARRSPSALGEGLITPNRTNACAQFSFLASYRHDAEHEARQPAAVVQALIGRGSEAIHRHYVSVGFEALKKAALALADPL